jgi:hypothetical protein
MNSNKTTYQNTSVAKKSATRFAMLVSFSVLATLGLMYALQLILRVSA